MRIAAVVGTRPEIVKMAPVIRAGLARGATVDVVHTGQHYSWAMDGVFFDELGVPAPDDNLRVGSGSHAFQIGTIVSRIEEVFERRRPDVVLVEGDTNSVLAAAITANKMGIRVGHVEAGLRSNDRSMPEEINRILVDHLADLLFAPTDAAAGTLAAEGIPADRVHLTGNTVVDELQFQRERVDPEPIRARFGIDRRRYGLATVHRAENVNDPDRLWAIFAGLARVGAELDLSILAALHPRTATRLMELGLDLPEWVRPIPPLSYLEFLALHLGSALILTDSGGLQEEACILGVPCVTLRDNTERPESVDVGANVLAGSDPGTILRAAHRMIDAPRNWLNPFGDGHAGERIIDACLAAMPAHLAPGAGAAPGSDGKLRAGEVGEPVPVP